MSKITKRTIIISNMHCTSCAMNIDFEFEDLHGVLSSKTNYAKQISEIEFDAEKIGIEEIFKKLENMGYGGK